jgi:hypothetical protein
LIKDGVSEMKNEEEAGKRENLREGLKIRAKQTL